MKQIIATVLALVMLLSCVAMSATVTASAASVNDATDVKVPVYQSREDYMQGMNAGKKTAQMTTTAGEWEGIFKFTLKDAANVMINYGFADLRNYSWSDDYSFNVYSDVNLMNEVKLSQCDGNKFGYYGLLAKGTYYVVLSNEYTKEDTAFICVGQVDKNYDFLTISYVKTNNNQTATFKVNCKEEIKDLYVYTCNYGATSFSTTKICGSKVELNPNNQMVVAYANQPISHTNVAAIDIYGYCSEYYVNVLNDYTISLSNFLDKVAYTGKNIVFSNLYVEAGYDAASVKVSYKNNKKVGTASVTFTGTGTTMGSCTKTFTIVPSKVKVNKKISGSKVTLTWSKSKGAAKHVVEKKVGNKWKKVKALKGTSLKTSFTKGKGTQFRIYGMKTVGKRLIRVK